MSTKKAEILRMVKFFFFSVSAGAIQISSFALLNELLHLDYWFSYLISLVLSVLWNFTLNRKFTFASAANVPKAMLLVAAYYAVFTPATVYLEYYLTSAAIGICWNEYIVTAINMLLNLTTEYLYQRFVVFRKSIDTAKK